MLSVDNLVGRAGAVRLSVELMEVVSEVEVVDVVDVVDAEWVVCGRDE